MKYIINQFDELIIINDSGNYIFMIDKNNKWIKHEYGHNGSRIYYEDYTGFINKHY